MTDAAKTHEICRRLAEGESLAEICRGPDTPGLSTVYLWLQRDEEFRTRYMEAREMQADTYADQIIDISDDATNDWVDRKRADGTTERILDSEHVQRSRLRVDARKWVAAKLKPKKYGDATKLLHADADGNTIAMSTQDIATRVAAIMAAAAERGEK